jgi:hypothetical protein
MNGEKNSVLNFFDHTLSTLNDLPDTDVFKTQPTTKAVIPTFGIGAHTYVVQSFRQRKKGDTIFLQTVSEGKTERIIIPPEIAEVIARQRQQLTDKSRSAAARQQAEIRKAKGIVPGFMKKRGKKATARP